MPRWSRRLTLWTGSAAVWWLAYGWVSARDYQQTTEGWGIRTKWDDVLLVELVSAGLWVPLTVLALWLSTRHPLGRPTATAIGVHLAALAVAVAGRAWAVNEFNDWLGCYPALPPVTELIASHGQQHAFTYLLITGVGHALHYAEAHRRRETELVRAELAALRAQINPHFLFNALNTIAATVHRDPDQAERLIVQLGLLLRRAIDRSGEQAVPLATEVALAHAYWEIEQARFGDRLRVSWDIPPVALRVAVPPLLLQPLVENAVRHGLAPHPRGGQIRVIAVRRGDRLQLTVEDDGLGTPDGHAPIERVGLGNTRSRLRNLYGERHTFIAGSRPGGGFRVTLTVPWAEVPDSAVERKAVTVA